ncbi:nudC amine-terminal domain protein [Gregarina niphandrodes]|uniref:NudC amine-terminal domain protein n=1 Tax=Gregarina niphandrodes TaxID=110365 RepID=A0A023BDV4_GRENI|nr:nudC amine-terminal domain protein [Gregarina niphandrodes]EZG88495.1 nudC amine-terminal domain protein [Gregarina niphandrodes]|eukprot:XP_011128556.1 nudC amine-terminal domain protein [Gregarina niphandrodes]
MTATDKEDELWRILCEVNRWTAVRIVGRQNSCKDDTRFFLTSLGFHIHETFGGIEHLIDVLSVDNDVSQLLDSCFSFLRRRTDFYHVDVDGAAPYGLKQGEAFDMVVSTFDKHAHLHLKYEHDKRKHAVKEEEKSSRQETSEQKMSEQKMSEQKMSEQKMSEQKMSGQKVLAPVTVVKASVDGSGFDLSQRLSASSIGTRNGGFGDRFAWSQTVSELHLEYPMQDVVSSPDVVFRVGADYLWCVVERLNFHIKDTWLHPVKPSGTTWVLECARNGDYEPQQSLVIYVDKSKKGVSSTCRGTKCRDRGCRAVGVALDRSIRSGAAG